MFESSKTVRQRIFADFYFRPTRRAFTLIELLAVIASNANPRLLLFSRNRFQNVTRALKRCAMLHTEVNKIALEV